jgi:hypothetical protein
MTGSSIEEAPFDPTEPSSAEILGEWELAIQSMTFEQGMDRVLCMFLRDRENARQHYLHEVWADNWIEQDTISMKSAFNDRHRTSTVYSWITNDSMGNVTVGDIHTNQWVALIFHPNFNERGFPDSTIYKINRKVDFLSIYRDERRIHLFSENCETSFSAWTSQGQWPKDEAEWISIVIECSNYLGIPVLPMSLGEDSRTQVVMRWKQGFVVQLSDCPVGRDTWYDRPVIDFIEKVVPKEQRKRNQDVRIWQWGVRFLDIYNPGWRERLKHTGSLWFEQEKV